MKKTIAFFLFSAFLTAIFIYFSCDPPKDKKTDDAAATTTPAVADLVISFVKDDPSTGYLKISIATSTSGAVIKYKGEVTSSATPTSAIDDPKTGGTTYDTPFSVNVIASDPIGTKYYHIKVVASKSGLADSAVIYSYKSASKSIYGTVTWGPSSGAAGDPYISFSTDNPTSGYLEVTMSTTGDTIKYKAEVTTSSTPSSAIDNPGSGGTTYSTPFSVHVTSVPTLTYYYHIKAVASESGSADSFIIYSYKYGTKDLYGATTWGP